MNQGSIHQEVITIIYAPYNGAPKYVKQKKGRIEGENRQFNNNN